MALTKQSDMTMLEAPILIMIGRAAVILICEIYNLMMSMYNALFTLFLFLFTLSFVLSVQSILPIQYEGKSSCPNFRTPFRRNPETHQSLQGEALDASSALGEAPVGLGCRD